MADTFDAFGKQLLEAIGLRKEELAPSEYASCSEYPPYKLYKYAKPGDHIAAWSNSRGYWHHAIFFGEDTDGHDYVIDNMPDIGVSKRSFEAFWEGEDALVVVHYTGSLDLDVSLRLAVHATTCYKMYNYATWNCDKFALLCRTGRCGMFECCNRALNELKRVAELKLHAPKRWHAPKTLLGAGTTRSK